MQVVYPICCGVDVHKTFLVATLIKTVGVEPQYTKKRFSTHNGSVLQLKKWLLENDCQYLCMESTGKYWIPVYNLLEDSIQITLANPKWVSAVKGNKDDVKDSKWIGDLFRLGLVPGSFIPIKPFRILREFTRYRTKLVGCRSGERNRFQNALTVCNISLDSVLSTLFGKSAMAVTDYLMSEDSFDSAHCASLLYGSAKKKCAAVVESIEGNLLTDIQKERIRIIRRHMIYIDGLISNLDQTIDEMVLPYESQIKLLCTIPGVERPTAIVILAEIGTDMSQFDSSNRLCSWAGLTPGSNQSAGKKKSVRIMRSGTYLKPALVEAANAATRCTNNVYYRTKYERIARRRGNKRAKIAIARMILTAVYHMLRTGEVFNPCDLFKIDMPKELLDKQKQKSLWQAAKLLISQGIVLPEHINLPDSA
jgi:transposase